MKIITIKTKYYLLKPHDIPSEDYKYYYVKIENELMPERAVWMQGYINHLGGISTVGCPFEDEELVKQLDAELEEALSKDRERCWHYEEAQGKHRCFHPDRKRKKCEGVCEDYEEKK